MAAEHPDPRALAEALSWDAVQDRDGSWSVAMIGPAAKIIAAYGCTHADALAFAALMNAAAQPPAVQGWRPISEAPRDGMWVLGFWPRVHPTDPRGAEIISDMRWCAPERGMREHWARGGRFTPGDDPTHFMPLPAPPVERASGAEGGA